MRMWQWSMVLLLSGISLALQFFSDAAPHHFSWEALPIFYIGFGFLGCAVMIIVPKLLGKLFLVKDEDYYDAR